MSYGTQDIDYYIIGKVDNIMLVTFDGRSKKKTVYRLTVNFAKELCMIARTEQGKAVRLFLIKQSEQVENALLLSREQVLEIVRMIKVFSVYEYRKLALAKNAENYINNALMIHPEYSKNKNTLYGKFHQWRNEVNP